MGCRKDAEYGLCILSSGREKPIKVSDWRIALLFVATVIIYANSLQGSFQFDDYNVIVDNRSVHTFPAWLDDLPGGIRPLLKLTYLLNWSTGPTPFSFHLVNLLIHLTNLLLVYAIAGSISSANFCKDALVTSRNTAFLTAALFALHPVQTEAVTYICSRSTSLMTLFYLGSIYAYIVGRDRKRKILLWLISPLLFICALLTKEVAVTLPAALLLLDICRQEREKLPTIVHRQSLHWALLLTALVLLLLHPRYLSLLAVSLNTRSISENLLTQLDAISYLGSKLLLLSPLNIDPDLPVVTALSLSSALQGALLTVTITAAVSTVRRFPVFACAILWFFLHLLPTNSIIPRLDAVNERQLYLPSIGLFLLVGHGTALLAGGDQLRRRTLQAAAGCLLMLLAWATIVRNRDYRSEITLWEQTARVSPGKARPFNNLGYAYFQAQRYPAAIEAYQNALHIQPDYKKAAENLRRAEIKLQEETAGKWFFKGIAPDRSRD